MQTTTSDQAAGHDPTEPAAPPAGPADQESPGGHRLHGARRRRTMPGRARGASARPPGRPSADDLAGRLRRVRATQAGFDGETRMRRLLTAVLLSELVLVIVLAAAQSWLGLIVALAATAVVVAAIMVFGPYDEPPSAQDGTLDHVVAGQKEELATLRRRAADAEASVSLLAELAGRHRALLVRQLTQIDQLEAKEADPAALGELFALDHLATRMRRCSEGVLLLSGRDEQRAGAAPVAASEVLRGAVAEVEDFSRVEVSLDRDVEVAGPAVVDVVHLLAELIENATVFSSPATPVRVRGHVTGDAFAVTVTDQGVGIDPERLAALNSALASGAVPVTPGQVGFPVVARLAARQGLYVGLAATAEGGTEATVVLPAALVGGQGQATVLPVAPPAPSTPPPAAPPPAAPPVAAVSAPVTYAPLPEEPPAGPLPVEVTAAQTYQPIEQVPAADAPAYEPPAYEPPAYEPATALAEPTYPAYDTASEPAYDTAFETSEDPLGLSAADLEEAGEPELAWSIPAVPEAPRDTPTSWSEPAWEAAAEPAPFVPPVHVEAPPPAPLAPLPEPVPVTAVAGVPPVPAPATGDTTETPAGLVRRIPLTNMAPQIAPPDHALADDVASQPTPDRSRHLFAAYRDGLTLGRGGLDDIEGRPDEATGEVPQ